MNLIKQHRALSAFAGSLLLITALVWMGQLIWPAALEAHDLSAVESTAASTSQAPATPQPTNPSPQPLQTTASSQLPLPSPTPSPKPEPTEPPLETDEQGVVQEHLSVATFKPDQSTLYVRAFKANVRQEPRTDVPVLDQLEMGDLLTRTGYGEFWSQVKTADNQTGYVLTELLSEDIIYKPKAPEPTRPPQPTPQPSQASAPQATQPLATHTEETKPAVSEESQAPVESQPAPEQPGESEEFLLFARVVALEGQKYVYDSYLSVATVIMNHVAHPAYPNTVTGVLKRKGAFYTYSQAAAGSPATLPDAAYQAAYDAYYLDKRNMPAYVIAFATPQAYANNAYFQSLSVYDRKYNTVWCYNERDKK